MIKDFNPPKVSNEILISKEMKNYKKLMNFQNKNEFREKNKRISEHEIMNYLKK